MNPELGSSLIGTCWKYLPPVSRSVFIKVVIESRADGNSSRLSQKKKSLNYCRFLRISKPGPLQCCCARFSQARSSLSRWESAAVALTMVMAGFLGTYAGRQVLDRLNDRIFKRALTMALVLISSRLIYAGLTELYG